MAKARFRAMILLAWRWLLLSCFKPYDAFKTYIRFSCLEPYSEMVTKLRKEFKNKDLVNKA